MQKTLIIATSEFTTLTRSKAFLIGLFLMPVFMIAAMLLQRTARDQRDTLDRPFVVIDHTGVLYGPLKAASDEWNAAAVANAARATPRFLPSAAEPGGAALEALRAELSDRVR